MKLSIVKTAWFLLILAFGLLVSLEIKYTISMRFCLATQSEFLGKFAADQLYHQDQPDIDLLLIAANSPDSYVSTRATMKMFKLGEEAQHASVLDSLSELSKYHEVPIARSAAFIAMLELFPNEELALSTTIEILNKDLFKDKFFLMQIIRTSLAKGSSALYNSIVLLCGNCSHKVIIESAIALRKFAKADALVYKAIDGVDTNNKNYDILLKEFWARY